MDIEQISSTLMCQFDIYYAEDQIKICTDSARSTEFTPLKLSPEKLK